MFEEVAAHFRHKEQHRTKGKQKYRNWHQIVYHKVRIERDTINWVTFGILVLFNRNAVWVVRPNIVEGDDVHHHQRNQYDRHGNHVQRHKTV